MTRSTVKLGQLTKMRSSITSYSLKTVISLGKVAVPPHSQEEDLWLLISLDEIPDLL